MPHQMPQTKLHEEAHLDLRLDLASWSPAGQHHLASIRVPKAERRGASVRKSVAPQQFQEAKRVGELPASAVNSSAARGGRSV